MVVCSTLPEVVCDINLFCYCISYNVHIASLQCLIPVQSKSAQTNQVKNSHGESVCAGAV